MKHLSSESIARDARQRFYVLALAGFGLVLPLMIMAIKPSEYGLVEPAMPLNSADRFRLASAQALFWLHPALNAVVILLGVSLQVRLGRASVALLLSILSAATLLGLWCWLVFSDFG